MIIKFQVFCGAGRGGAVRHAGAAGDSLAACPSRLTGNTQAARLTRTAGFKLFTLDSDCRLQVAYSSIMASESA
jgi:hypothetical protein